MKYGFDRLRIPQSFEHWKHGQLDSSHIYQEGLDLSFTRFQDPTYPNEAPGFCLTAFNDFDAWELDTITINFVPESKWEKPGYGAVVKGVDNVHILAREEGSWEEVRHILLHELGHIFGLHHDAVAIMSADFEKSLQWPKKYQGNIESANWPYFVGAGTRLEIFSESACHGRENHIAAGSLISDSNILTAWKTLGVDCLRIAVEFTSDEELKMTISNEQDVASVIYEGSCDVLERSQNYPYLLEKDPSGGKKLVPFHPNEGLTSCTGFLKNGTEKRPFKLWLRKGTPDWFRAKTDNSQGIDRGYNGYVLDIGSSVTDSESKSNWYRFR